MRDAELKIEAERWCHCSTTRYQIENTNTCRIDVLKDEREREKERERERVYSGRNKEKGRR